MSHVKTLDAAGIRHLIIEEVACDAQLEGIPDAVSIQAFYPPLGDGGERDVAIEAGVAHLTGPGPLRVVVPHGLEVTVKSAPGNLRVQGLAGDLSLESVRGDLRLADLQGVVRVAQVDADVRAQGVADLRLLGNCNGDLRFENGGLLSAEAIGGDVRIANAGEIRLGRVRGNLWAERLRQSLQVARVDGDARLAEVSGLVTLRSLAGDLRASAVTGGLTASQVHGDVLYQGPFGAPETITVAADGDILFHLPADADIHVSAVAGGRLRSDIPLTPASDGSAAFTATLGRGLTRVTLSSGGDLRIVQPAAATTRTRDTRQADLSALGEQIRQQVAASLAAAGIRVETDAANRAQERPRAGRESRTPRPSAPEHARQPGTTSGPSREEELAVLKMVEEGKITPEEADVLLRALGA